MRCRWDEQCTFVLDFSVCFLGISGDKREGQVEVQKRPERVGYCAI